MIIEETDLRVAIIKERVRSIVHQYIYYKNKGDNPLLRELTKKIKGWIIAGDKYKDWGNNIIIEFDQQGYFRIDINIYEGIDKGIDVIFSNEFKTLSYRLNNAIPLDEMSDNPLRNITNINDLEHIFYSPSRLVFIHNDKNLETFCFPEVKFTKNYIKNKDTRYDDGIINILASIPKDEDILIMTNNTDLGYYENLNLNIRKGN